MSISPRRFLIAAAVAAFSTATVLSGVPAATAASSSAVTSGYTYITPSARLVRTLASHHIVLSAIRPASIQVESGPTTTIALPITGGTATPPNYVTRMAGGLRFKLHTHVVTLTNLVFNTKTHLGTAIVNHAGRFAIFQLGDPQGGSGGPGSVSFGGYTVSLTRVGWTKLDSKLGTMFFAYHKLLGTGTTDVKF
jgi:hypothetical protein